MKKLLPVLLALFLLTNCSEMPSSSEVPQESTATTEDVAARYAEAAAVYDWFDLCSPHCTGEPVDIDGCSYRKVDVEGLATYADLEAKVRALFSPTLADEILSNGKNFRDVDGQLYCAESARGSHIDLAGKTITVEHPDEDHFAVELLFWTDHPAEIPDQAPDSSGAYLVGYSRTVLNYEKTDTGFRFTNFCSSDALDLNADTVCFFPDRSSLNVNDHTTDWEAICALLVSDDAGFEEIAYDLPHRFLDHPQELLHQLSILYNSPLQENDDQRYLSVEDVLTRPMIPYDPGCGQSVLNDARVNALDACTPETPAEQAVLDLLRKDFTALTRN